MQAIGATTAAGQRLVHTPPTGQVRAGRAAAGTVVGGLSAGAVASTLASGPVGWTVTAAGCFIGGLLTALYDWVSLPTETHRNNVVQAESALRQDIARASERVLSTVVGSIEEEASNFISIGHGRKHRELHLAALERRLEFALTRLGRPSSSLWLAATNATIISYYAAMNTHQRAWFSWGSNNQAIERLEQQVRREITMANEESLKAIMQQLHNYRVNVKDELCEASVYSCIIFAHETMYNFLRMRTQPQPPLAQGVNLEEPK